MENLNRELYEDEKKEIQSVYTKYAKQGLKACKNMTPSEESEYDKKELPKMVEELENIKQKYNKIFLMESTQK